MCPEKRGSRVRHQVEEAVYTLAHFLQGVEKCFSLSLQEKNTRRATTFFPVSTSCQTQSPRESNVLGGQLQKKGKQRGEQEIRTRQKKLQSRKQQQAGLEHTSAVVLIDWHTQQVPLVMREDGEHHEVLEACKDTLITLE